ncbi:SusD/RagB family nutrient-binding outer membrane lipoprotein [Niabella terrae]
MNKYILLLSLFIAGCTKNFEKINTDPNRPKEITPGVMLDQLQYRIVNTTIKASKSFTNALMQVDAPRSSAGGGGLHRYQIGTNAGIWTDLYDRLTDIQDIYSMSLALEEDNYRAIALIYKSWAYSILTDLYGDVPYTEATRASEALFQPKFDRQKDIYEQLLHNLDTAASLLDESRALTYGGDLVYDANSLSGSICPGIVKWKKFANSLKLRLLLRIYRRQDEINIAEQIQTILADPTTYPVFNSNADEAIFRYTGSYPYFNPYYKSRQVDWRDNDYYTKFFLKTLNEAEDPRRAVWANQVKVDGQLQYSGIESGYPADLEYQVGKNSSYSDDLKTLESLGIMMTYAEVEFIKAELALKGFNTGQSPKAHYEQGIAASMNQWDVTMPADFLTRPAIAYPSSGTETTQLEQIMLQKYYAYFFVDYQSWFEKRRTGYPVLPRGAGIPAENIFPNRIAYPTYLQSLNAENLAAAVAAMGGDNSDIKVWWAQ